MKPRCFFLKDKGALEKMKCTAAKAVRRCLKRMVFRNNEITNIYNIIGIDTATVTVKNNKEIIEPCFIMFCFILH